jgi:polyisoprenoid-binding protein YceI
MRILWLVAILFALVAIPIQARAPKDVVEKPLRIDKNHSTLGFEVPIVDGLSKVTGKFTDFDIQIIWNDDPAQSSVQAAIQVASIDTGIDDRDGDLRSDNFFDAATYPEITFVSDEITGEGEEYGAHGTLTMHGVSEEIDLPFQLARRDQGDGGEWLAFAADYTLDRTTYGIDWEHGIVPFFVGDDVTVKLFVITR